MITNSIGTLIYSLFHGKKVAEDKNGNKFFRHKRNKNKRWVLYNETVDPTILEVKWQVWLTDTDKDAKPINKVSDFIWQKQKNANLTGTNDSYHPRKDLEDKKLHIKKENTESSWKPDK